MLNLSDYCGAFGYPQQLIAKIAAQLAHPTDVDRDQPILERYNLTSERLMDRLGANP